MLTNRTTVPFLLTHLVSLFVSEAWAMGPPPGSGQGGIPLAGFIPLILIFVLFYFLLIRPLQRRAKKHRQMLSATKKGDKVISQDPQVEDEGHIMAKRQSSLPVIIAYICIGCILIFNIWMFVIGYVDKAALGIFFTLLFLVGTIKKSKLVWQWGQWLVVAGILVSAIQFIRIFGMNIMQIVLAVFQLVFYIIFFISFTHKGTKKYFGLVCPGCGSESVKAVDFLFTMAKCKRCSTQW